MPDGAERIIADLRIGDQVLALGDEGQIVVSEVYCFAHRDQNIKASFVTITTSDGSTIELSPDHLLGVVVDGKVEYVPAQDAMPGMDVLTVDRKECIQKASVMSVSSANKHGLFTPLTMQGTLFVNGVAASCYASLQSHAVCHLALAPMRCMYTIMPSLVVFGQYGMLDEQDLKGSHVYTELGSYLVPTLRALGV